MKLTFLLAGLLSVSVLLTAGCGCGGGGGDDGVKSSVNNELSDMNDIAKRVDGKYDKLTAEEKKKFSVYGDENAARHQLMLMAHPPNEKHMKK